MELDRALSQIAQIHEQVVRAEMFRGYRALPQALTGAFAFVGAAVQDVLFVPSDASAFLVFWLAVAALCVVVCAADLWRQQRVASRSLLRQRSLPVLAQFAPALAVGAALTWILEGGAHAALLPGLWAVLHGLGIFASRPFLPRSVGWVSLFYLAAGVVLVAGADVGAVPSPWGMGLTFGVGQGALAFVLHRDLERGRLAEVAREESA